MNKLTGIKDVDREILKHVRDGVLENMRDKSADVGSCL